MKKLLSILFVLILTIGLTACNSSKQDETVEVPETITILGQEFKVEGKVAEILEKGKLVISTAPPYPPMEFVDELSGEILGCEMELAAYIADALGVELVVESMDFEGTLITLDTDKVDLSISGFGYKPDRAEHYELSDGYWATISEDHHTIVVRTEDLDKYNSLEDFNVEGLVMAAQTSSVQQMYVEDELPNVTIEFFSDFSKGILDLTTGKVDAIALDSTTAKNYADTSDGAFVSLYDEKGIEFDLSPYAGTTGNVMAAKKGETTLIEICNVIVKEAMESGQYRQWYLEACELSGIEPEE